MPPFGIHQYLALIIVAVSLWALGSVWMGLQATGQWVGTWQQQVWNKWNMWHAKIQHNGCSNGWGQFVADDVRDVAKRMYAVINEDEVALLGMREVLDKVESLAWFVTVLLALAMALIVSNTLRMILLARADEVHLMRLMGAKEWFVRMPFVLEGLVLGAGAGLLAWLLLWPWVWGSNEWLAGSMVELHVGILFIPLLLGGALLGCLGALIATARLVSPDSVVEA